MIRLNTVLVCALFAAIPACGRQVVEFRLDDTSTADSGTGTVDTGTGTGDTSVPNERPYVTFTDPTNGAVDVAVSTAVTATFSEPMSPATISGATFTVKQGTTPISGTVTLDATDTLATFTPTTALDTGLVYTADVTTGAEDTSGLAMAADRSWTFTTHADVVPPVHPKVVDEMPVDGAIDVHVDSVATATFDEPMDAATIDDLTFTLDEGFVSVPGTVTLDASGFVATFTPDDLMDEGQLYTATVTTGAQAPDGLGLVDDFVWSFTVLAPPDPPLVIATTPLDGASNVSINLRPTATFNRDMDPLTLDSTTFTLAQGAVPVTGVVSWDVSTDTATFAPDLPLQVGVPYLATIHTGATDTSGVALASDYAWAFSTDACGMAMVDLGGASSFGALAGSTVTSTGPTSITGDVGVSPGTDITGFPPGSYTGAAYAGTPTAATGIADLTTAYDEVATRSLCAVTVDGNLGGETLAPGLYKSTSSLEVSSGDLTLDAGGDPDAVFIFQMASTLTTTDGRQVILSGGALASHVFWQVGSSATIGTTSVFVGTVMADQSITLKTGATLNGRALARIGAVTLDSNTIVVP